MPEGGQPVEPVVGHRLPDQCPEQFDPLPEEPRVEESSEEPAPASFGQRIRLGGQMTLF